MQKLQRNRSSNVFLFKRPDNCEVNQLEFFDLDPVTGNTSFIGQWCLEHANSFAGRPGFPTVIRYVTHNVTETNVTLFVQGSYVMPEEQCPPTLLNLTAGYNETRLSVRGFLDRLPNGMKCSWIFRTPGKGVLHLKLFSFPWHITGSRYR
nr:hypothetical protein BaRGS_021060 [Batillaria attramentaria]